MHVLAWNGDFDLTKVVEVALTEATYDPATWHHVSVTAREGPPEGEEPTFGSIDSTQIAWFLDGKVVDTRTGRGGFRLSPVGPAYLAGVALDAVTRFPGEFSRAQDRHLQCFKGALADVRVWRTALTEAQIAAGMRFAPLAEETGNVLVAYLPLSESLSQGPFRDPRAVESPERKFGYVADFVRDNMVLLPREMTSDAGYAHYAKPEARAWSNYTFTGRFCLLDGADFLGLTVLSQHTADVAPQDRFYSLLWEKNDNRRTFRLYCHPPALQSLDATTLDLGVIPVAKKWHRFSITVKGSGKITSVSAKVWAEDSPDGEPAEPQAMATDNSIYRLGNGTVGVWTQGAGNVYLDKLEVLGLPVSVPERGSIDKAPSGIAILFFLSVESCIGQKFSD